jgi:hypothetical protein
MWLMAVSATLALLADQGCAGQGHSQEEKMRSCNADATAHGLQDDDRKAFMKTCLLDYPAAAHE